MTKELCLNNPCEAFPIQGRIITEQKNLNITLEQSPHKEAANRSSGQEILRFLWNLMVLYRVD